MLDYTTMVVLISTTMVVDEAFVTIAHRIVWCTVATVDRRGRPRSRILHPYWERTPDGLVGWITSRAAGRSLPASLQHAALAGHRAAARQLTAPRQELALA